MLPFEKKTIRIYMFYFRGYEEPLVIEAENKKAAMGYLVSGVHRLPMNTNVDLEDLKITTPVYGVTEKDENGITYIWAGFDEAVGGWLPKTEFIKLKKR